MNLVLYYRQNCFILPSLSVSRENRCQMGKNNKKSSTKKTMQFVTMPVATCANRPKEKKKKPKNNKKGGGKGSNSEAYRQYRMVLRDPFSPQAEGVRLPDTFRYPTTTVKFRQRVALTSDAGGVLAFTVLPTPFFTLQMGNGTQTGLATFGGNLSISRMMSRGSAITAQYGQYRVVGWGFRLLMSDTALAAKGIYTVAPVPIPQNSILDPTQMEALTMGVQFVTDYLGVPRPDGSTELLPHARTFNAQDLMYKGDFRAVGVPYDSACKDFRSIPTDSLTVYQSNPLYTARAVGSLIATTGIPPSTVNVVGNYSTLDMSGNIGFLVYATGLPASTQELVMEITYHVEFILNPNSANIASSIGASPPVGSTAILENIYTSVRDVFYFDKETLETVGNLGMAGLKYYNGRKKQYL